MKKTTLKKRLLSIFLTISIVISGLSGFSLLTAADAADAADTRIVDPSTMDNWKKFYGQDVLTSSMAGGVWSDKSVFKDTSAFSSELGISMTDPQNNFLVALSAIASNKSIVGYSNIPTDTMLVLDLSNSMTSDNMSAMISATNSAIKTLQDTNYNNRVGVVLYSGNTTQGSSNANTATVILDLDRYSHANDIYLVYEGGQVKVNSGVKMSDGSNAPARSKSKNGGTYIQNGIYKAMTELLSVPKADTVITEGYQAGAVRMPIIVLMSDGAPTAATSSYNNVGKSNYGDGTSTNDNMVFLTQLTSAYAKARIEDHYENDALFYTLGLGVSNDTGAIAVLDPSRSSTSVNSKWTSYLNLKNNGVLSLSNNLSVKRDMTLTEEYRLYTDQAYTASGATGLTNAFKDIVQQIIIQSLYYPTFIENGNTDLSGYLRFVDDVGEYMDVKDIKGVVMGDTLFTGAMLARNFVQGGGGLGTVDNPTSLGNEFIHAVQQRLGIESVADARDLVRLAFEYRQLSYTSDTEFSNYIGWYANDNGDYLGFWHAGHTAADAPAQATYINRSYGLLGAVQDGVKKTDMMYASIQVHTNIATGDVSLIWAIPAALIPVISYSVSFDGETLDNARNIKVEITDQTPIRLVYEIGLRDDITPINISEKVADDYKYKNADGTYTFYTNKWDVGMLEDGSADSEQINAVSFFDPSMENERFYYTKNEPIYVKSGSSYIEYTGSTLAGGTYYRKHEVFTVTDKATGAAIYENHYDAIYAESLAKAVKNDDNTWYIPKGTVLPSARLNAAEKTANPTETLKYAGYPTIELAYTDNAQVQHYYVDAILGNNGKITVTPAQGLKITKTLEAEVPGAGDTFVFDIAGSDTSDSSTYSALLVDKNGNELVGSVTFDGGSASFALHPGQSLYIIGLPTGSKYTVSEQTHDVYSTKSINGQSIKEIELTVEEYVISAADFLNAPKGNGSLIIQKQVEHRFGSDWSAHKDKLFTFKVDLGAAQANKTFSMTYAGGTEDITSDENGSFTVTLKDGESVKIDGITEDTAVTVTETDMPVGFTPREASIDATISSTENAVVTFVNDYKPATVYPVNVTLDGDKTLVGREWLDSDTFSFALQRLDGAVWTNVDTQTVNKADKTFSFTDALSAEQFSAPGIYDYRIIEVKGSIGGMTYDSTYRYFTIEVTDTDADGRLEIGKVTAGTDVKVTNDNNTYSIDVGFGNKYAPLGDATVAVDITKFIENNTSTEIPLSGFTFGLFNQGNLVTESSPTNETGGTTMHLTFLASDAGKRFVYTLREIVPEQTIPGMIYSDEMHTVVVDVIDNLDGSISARIHKEGEQGYDNTFSAEFTNKYIPEEVDVTINGSKVLHGKDMAEGEFSFDLYKVDGSTETYVETATHNEAGYFSFETLVFTTTGTYTYRVREKAGTASYMSYDDSAYTVVITVTDDNGVLIDSVAITDDAGSPAERIIFENTYTPAPTTAAFGGTKKLTGRELMEGEFTFELYRATAGFVPAATPIRTATNGIDGMFAFDSIEYTEAGVWYYVISENASASIGGITYDRRTYHVTVTVTDDGEGTLTAAVKYTDHANRECDVLFENSYSPAPAALTVDGEKVLIGRELSFGEFKFDIYEATGEAGSYKRTGKVIASAENLADGSFTFAPITFDTEGTYKYVIVEDTSAALDRMTYDTTVYELTVTATDNGRGALVLEYNVQKQAGDGVAAAAADVSVVFTNIYTPKPADVTADINIKKTVNNIGTKTLSPGGFRFMIKNTDTGAVDYVNSDSSGNAKFTLSYAEEDIGRTFNYEVTEVKGDRNNVIYSETVYTVTVTVSLDEQANRLVLTKTLDGAPVDTVNASFVNIYEEYVPYTTAVIEGKKNLTGRELAAGEFEFELFPADGDFNITGDAIASAKNDADGKIVFEAIPFTSEGTANYVIREKVDAPLGGVIYDVREMRASIKVTDDGKGILTAVVRYYDDQGNGSALEFNNSYVPTSTEVSVSGNKTLNGRELATGEFTFAIYEAAGEAGAYTAQGSAKLTATNGSDGSFTFAPLVFESAGVYKYVIVEDASAPIARITYDTTVYELTVTVTDDGAGTLSSTYAIMAQTDLTREAEVEFTNIYTPAPDPITVDINIDKTVKGIGGSISPEGFEFKLKDEQGETFVKTAADGKARFTLTYTEADIGHTYTYTVTEVKGEVKGVTYSDAVYTVSVKITLSEDNTLKAEITVNEAPTENAVCAFENIYVFEAPDTGDSLNLLGWISALFVSAMALFTLVIIGKKIKF